MRRPVSTRPKKSARPALLRVESLEARQLLTLDLTSPAQSMLTGAIADVSAARPGAIARPVATPFAATSAITPAAGATASAPYTPAQIRHAYGFDQLSYDGTGQTIAIVDAYDDPTIEADLKAFDAKFGLPDPTFTKATPQGTPAFNAGWATEIALDVEWAHAIAPRASILLVEATSPTDTGLFGAVDYAVQQGAKQVSMSWGGGEYSNVSEIDTHFNQPGVTFLASAGDSGAQVELPAVSPYVTGVGGTTMPLDSAGNRVSETVWSGSGGGISTQVARPSYQAGFVSGSYRGVPDVSYDADPGTGVFVDDNGNWYGVGGTSIGAPQWAGLIALANQGRATAGLPSLGTGQAMGTNSVLYGLAGGSSYTNPNGDFLDITSGSNGNSATNGYDPVTGLGSPVANKLVPNLVGPVSPPAPAPAPPPPTTGPAVGDSGFESVKPGDNGATYDPSGSAWSFLGNSGISNAHSGFTWGNSAAPEGTQVAFLQGSGQITQSVSGWAAGTYQVSFEAAQRGNNGGSNQDFAVLVDGAVVSTFRPTGKPYQSYSTASFTVTAGAHTIAFQGLNSVGGDNTAFLDQVSIASA